MKAIDKANEIWTKESSALAGGGDPPDDGLMRERLAAIEALIPTLATRADLGDLRADFERGQKENRAWMLATVIALFLGCLAVGNFLASGLERAAPPPTPATAPIVIQVPSPPPPPRPPAE